MVEYVINLFLRVLARTVNKESLYRCGLMQIRAPWFMNKYERRFSRLAEACITVYAYVADRPSDRLAVRCIRPLRITRRALWPSYYSLTDAMRPSPVTVRYADIAPRPVRIAARRLYSAMQHGKSFLQMGGVIDAY